MFSLFNSPVGIELLDMRAVALWYVEKSPNLMALVESFGPQTLGQWIFACDSHGDCNLTFGRLMGVHTAADSPRKLTLSRYDERHTT